MNIIVIGMGEVGKHIAFMLALENNNVIIIDADQQILSSAEEKMDVMAIGGHGASPKTLKQAQIEQADLLIAVTNNDEINLLAANLGRELGAKKTIARVSNKEFLPEGRGFYHNYLGVDLILNPNILTALEITNIIRMNHAVNSHEFAENRIQLIEMAVNEDSKILSAKISDIKLPELVSLICIVRNNKIIIPTNDEEIQITDHIFFLGEEISLKKIDKYFEQSKLLKEQKIMLVGGSEITFEVASELEKNDIRAIVIDQDRERCEQLSQKLEKTSVVCGDASNPAFLQEENIKKIELFAALSNKDELNLMTALLAKREGVNKNIALTQKSGYLKIYNQLGIDVSISPRLMIANQILKFVRKGDVVNAFIIAENQAEVLEILVKKESRIEGMHYSEVNLPKESSVLMVLKSNGKIIKPESFYQFEDGDHVLMMTTTETRSNVEKLFRKKTILI